MTNCIVLIHCMCDILCVVRNCVYHHVCESKRIERERVELLFSTHLRKSLVIEKECVIYCVWYAFAHHMCVTVREYRAFVWYAFA